MSGRRSTSLRPLGLAGLTWGALLLASGPELFRAVQRREPSDGEQTALLLLGVRHAAQGVLQVLAPHHLAVLHAGVDGLHAASMAALAAVCPERRRAVLVSAGIATLAGVAALRERSR